MNRTILFLLNTCARAVLRKYRPKIIAVTGTVGKTSMKEAVYTLLKHECNDKYIYRSPKSFNGEWGVPLSILTCTSGYDDFLSKLSDVINSLKLVLLKVKYPDIVILEIGVNKPGEIQSIAQWIQLDALVITTISNDSPHLDEFKEPELILKDKASLLKSLKSSGVLILNNDNETSMYFIKKWSGRTVFYGLNEDVQITARDYKVRYTDSKISGFSFSLREQDKLHHLNVDGCLGIHHVYPILAAVAVANEFGCKLRHTFPVFISPPGRMRIFSGKNESTIIDDSFNASPVATEKAISSISQIKAKRKIVALSFMLGLENREIDCHQEIFQLLRKSFDIICLVGMEWKNLLKANVERGSMVLFFKTSSECGKYIESILCSDDIVLIKGSQLFRMEKIVEMIISDRYDKITLLARQEDYWLKV